MQRIAVITPISHLDGVKELVESKGKVYYLENNPDKSVVKSLLIRKKINIIVCNPNQQSFKIDKELLDMTEVKLINSCSTGLNHIDLEYCQNNNIEIQCHKNDYELINNLPSTSELDLNVALPCKKSTFLALAIPAIPLFSCDTILSLC